MIAAVAVLSALAALAGPAGQAGKAGAVGTARGADAAGAVTQTGPVRVDADQVHYAFQKRQVIFTGKPVVLTREDAKLTCARLVAQNDDAGQIVTATCEGNVKLVRGDRTVTCDAANYENAFARVTCDGNAVLRDRGAEARGERLVYELATDDVKLEGGGASGGVHIVLPGDEVDARQRELEERRRQRKDGKP